jgi:hypothetical protein
MARRSIDLLCLWGSIYRIFLKVVMFCRCFAQVCGLMAQCRFDTTDCDQTDEPVDVGPNMKHLQILKMFEKRR